MGNRTKRFEKLYKEAVDDVFRYISMRLNDKERATDLTQESFVRMWNSYYKKNENIDNERALLFKIAHNLLVNAYERDKKNYSIEEMSERGEDLSNDDYLNIELKSESSILRSRIEKLDPIYRDVIFLRYIENLPVNEIAKIIEESESSTSVRIHRGIKKLKEIYGE